ncbi:uncharacterized protein LOC106879023 [Octopus bimaculoides]|uniref:uncharacterized protein LOC106879023 n=1 Tax=Octopus bimaculoides TaxID=37653 RepID=UPI00071E5B35|nr:uncharacterized protein LOC106879023 [Octopus bimaculoides]|eukprot:XP_014783912.1 PREDICTED: uncharacterized protein LOC106879023 [Octopus bimaculoides]
MDRDYSPSAASMTCASLTPSFNSRTFTRCHGCTRVPKSDISYTTSLKSPGSDDVSGEIYKYGGPAFVRRLHRIILYRWKSVLIRQRWKHADIISIFKKKGDRSDCSQLQHYRHGLRLPPPVTEEPEQQRDASFAFIDLTKAFDTTSRLLLWNVLHRYGCPPKLLARLRQFHDGMQARVTLGGDQSDYFNVQVGVKQGCVLAPVLFNVFLVAVRRDGSLFNLRRLNSLTPLSSNYTHSSSDLEGQDPTYRDPETSEIDRYRMHNPRTSTALGGACYKDTGKRYTQDCLLGELAESNRPHGGPKKRYKYHLKKSLEALQHPPW